MPRISLRSPVVACAAIGLVALVVAADWWTCLPPGRSAAYVGRQACAPCHERELHQWLGSDHDLAMDLATPETVLGDFADRVFTYQGVVSRMFRRGDDYVVHTDGPDGVMRDYKIKYTFGVRPLQQYMVEFPDGRVQVLRISWDTEQRRWIYVPPPDVVDQRIDAGDPLHWTGVGQNWNHTCAECHSTDLRKNYNLAANTYHTSFSEIDVSCEACHGPCGLHVELAEARSLFWDRRYGYGLVQLKKGDAAKNELEACAVCHSRRHIVHAGFRPGNELLDHYEPALLAEGLYHADGQILDEVYEYGSFLQSLMYHKGVRCTDCHDPHSLQVKYDGNRLCGQCHQPGQYDGPAHHHHPIDSAGALCVECHMPEATYMVVDPRRDHSLRIPRPDLTGLLGTPNVCNRCHTKEDETPAWAAAKIVEWYGERRRHDPHYALALAGGQQGEPQADRPLRRLLRRPDTPAIVKATAVSLLGQYSSAPATAALDQALTDASPLVRASAVRSIPQREPGGMLRLLAPLLTDPVRAVRTAAAVRLADVPRPLHSQKERAAFDKAVAEYETGQYACSDRAACHLNLGNLYQSLQKFDEAAAAFRTAIRLEPYLTGARSNLSSLLEAIASDPAEVRRLRQEEVRLLARDARLLPDSPIVHRRYGLTRYLLGDLDQAQEALETACRLAPGSFDDRLMLTLLYEKRAQWDRAVASARQLAALRPGNTMAEELRQRIEQSAGQRRPADR